MSYRKRGSRQYQPQPRPSRMWKVISLSQPRSRHAFRVRQWKVQSHSDPSKYYTVSLRKDGVYECSCPHWIYRHEECKHIREVKSQMKQPVTVAQGYVLDENGVKQYTLI